MLTILSLIALGAYAGICEACAHSPKVKGNSVVQVIRGLLKKTVETTNAEQTLATEFSQVEAEAAPTAAPATEATPAPAQTTTPQA